MQVKFHTFPVGAGDCITLLLKNGDKELHIMVDCGHYKPEVNDYIKNEFHGHIDYLIVTHIDNDHIKGLIEMLSSKPDLTINHIFYNCYQRTSDDLQEWDERMVENMKNVYHHLPIVIDMLEDKINAETSMSLAELILENENWKRAWRREYITENSLAIDLENDMGKFIFLSPAKKALDDLDQKYRSKRVKQCCGKNCQMSVYVFNFYKKENRKICGKQHKKQFYMSLGESIYTEFYGGEYTLFRYNDSCNGCMLQYCRYAPVENRFDCRCYRRDYECV